MRSEHEDLESELWRARNILQFLRREVAATPEESTGAAVVRRLGELRKGEWICPTLAEEELYRLRSEVSRLRYVVQSVRRDVSAKPDEGTAEAVARRMSELRERREAKL